MQKEIPNGKLRVKDVATRLGKTRTTVYRWIRVGILPEPDEGYPAVWGVAAIEQWIADHGTLLNHSSNDERTSTGQRCIFVLLKDWEFNGIKILAGSRLKYMSNDVARSLLQERSVALVS